MFLIGIHILCPLSCGSLLLSSFCCNLLSSTVPSFYSLVISALLFHGVLSLESKTTEVETLGSEFGVADNTSSTYSLNQILFFLLILARILCC